jgi:predicted phosphate transport protein (TIGR00153 family)
MSPIRLMPRDERFGALFIVDGENLRAATAELLEMITRYDDLEARVQRVRDLEHSGDVIGDDLIERLERAFITPFDREDIHELVSRVDDVVDRVQEIAETFLLYDVKAPTAEATELAGILDTQAARLLDAFHGLDTMKGLEAPLREVHELENRADGASRAAIAGLFRGGIDALEVIKWRDIYHYLEEAIDAAEDAAEVLERMYHKAT